MRLARRAHLADCGTFCDWCGREVAAVWPHCFVFSGNAAIVVQKIVSSISAYFVWEILELFYFFLGGGKLDSGCNVQLIVLCLIVSANKKNFQLKNFVMKQKMVTRIYSTITLFFAFIKLLYVNLYLCIYESLLKN